MDDSSYGFLWVIQDLWSSWLFSWKLGWSSALPKDLGSCQKVLGGRALLFCSVITSDPWSQLASSAQAPKRISLGTLRFLHELLEVWKSLANVDPGPAFSVRLCLVAAGKEGRVERGLLWWVTHFVNGLLVSLSVSALCLDPSCLFALIINKREHCGWSLAFGEDPGMP